MTFDEFAGARLPAVLRFATALAGDPDLAKDLVQEVLIRADRRWGVIGELDRPEAYIRKMVVNEYLSWRRRSWRLIPSGMSSHLTGRLSPDPADGYVERQALLAELAKLSRRRRTALVLRYYEGFSDAEIADVMGCTKAPSAGTSSGRSRPCAWSWTSRWRPPPRTRRHTDGGSGKGAGAHRGGPACRACGAGAAGPERG